jgi:hypothetical protein
MYQIETTCRCATCKAKVNREFVVQGVCVWCRRKTVEAVRASLHRDARTHIGRLCR